jgi:hypothetical protein
MGSAMKTLVTAMVIAAAATVAFSPTSSAQPTDPAAAPAVRACDWVTTAEVGDILGAPVTPQLSDDAAGSNDARCFYAASGEGIGVGISSELITPSASAVADRMLAHAATEPGAVTIDRLGVNAVCVYEPNVTPPSTTIVVLLDGGRVYRSTAAYEYCNTVERFARLAIDRITT